MFATSAVIFMTQKKAIPTAASPPAPLLKPFPTVGLARFAALARTVSLSWNNLVVGLSFYGNCIHGINQCDCHDMTALQTENH